MWHHAGPLKPIFGYFPMQMNIFHTDWVGQCDRTPVKTCAAKLEDRPFWSCAECQLLDSKLGGSQLRPVKPSGFVTVHTWICDVTLLNEAPHFKRTLLIRTSFQTFSLFGYVWYHRKAFATNIMKTHITKHVWQPSNMKNNNNNNNSHIKHSMCVHYCWQILIYLIFK